jgi:pyrroloquinoline quinone biosynthesis protein B
MHNTPMNPRPLLALLLPFLLLATLAAASPSGGPRVVVLGIAQDGGMPQTGCDCSHCAAARKDPSLARHVASLAIHIPKTGHVYLVDATPDLPAQVEMIHRFHPHPIGKTDRAPVDGILLTHAHIGHYLGLAHFGFESLNTKDIPVWASPRMAAYLRANGPWSQLVGFHNIALREFQPGQPFDIEEGISIKPIQVPHRDEYSDTMAFLIRGPHKTLLYVPDTDAWTAWPKPLADVIRDEKVDVALLDGTFYSPDELPDRDVSKIKHPLVTATMDLLEPLVRKGRLRVRFLHLNHSNPLFEKDGAARKSLAARGFGVAEEGEEIGL